MSDIEKIEKELIEKGVQPEVIESVLDSFADKDMATLIQKSAKKKAFGEEGEKPWEEEEEKSKKKSKKATEEDEDMKEKAFGEDEDEEEEEEKKSKKKSKKAMAEDEEEVKEKSLKLERLEKSIAEKEIEALKQEVASIRKASKIPSYYAVAKSSRDADPLTQFFMKNNERELWITKGDSYRTDENPSGGYLVRPDYINTIITYAETVNPLRKFASVGIATSNRVEQPRAYERNIAEKVGEANNTTTPRPVTDEFGVIGINIEDYIVKVALSRRTLRDSSINIESYILDTISRGFARSEARELLYGNGRGGPLGILNVPNVTTADISFDKIQTIKSGDASKVLLGDPDAGITGAITALDSYYHSNSRFYMSMRTYQQIRSLTHDSNYVYRRNQPADGLEGRPTYDLEGWPVEILPEMATNTTDKVVLFGDLREALQIYDHKQGVWLQKNEMLNPHEIVFNAIKAWGAKVIKPEALKIIKLGT